MSRGLGRVQRQILAFLANPAGAAPAAPALGWSAREIATAMAAGTPPTRSSVASVGRALWGLQEAGLVDIWGPKIRRPGANLFAQLAPAPDEP